MVHELVLVLPFDVASLHKFSLASRYAAEVRILKWNFIAKLKDKFINIIHNN